MEQGHPITVFLVTALVLWALYLWHQHRLGVIRPAARLPIGPPVPLIGPPALILPPPTFTPGIAPAPDSAPNSAPNIIGG